MTENQAMIRKVHASPRYSGFRTFFYQCSTNAHIDWVLVQLIDEYNWPANVAAEVIQVVPREEQIEAALFGLVNTVPVCYMASSSPPGSG